MREVKVDQEQQVSSAGPARPKQHRLAYVLTDPEAAWNPLRDWPRNEPCYCNSGKKFKKCCWLREPGCIKQKDAEAIKKAMQMGEVGRAGIRREFQRHRTEQQQNLAPAGAEAIAQAEHNLKLYGNSQGKTNEP